MLVGAVGLAAAPALAQPGRMRAPPMGDMAMGPAEQRHVEDTLMIGAVALQTSRLALSRGVRPLVRQFAEFEVEEQTTVAQILGEISGMGPPPPAPADRRLLDRLERARGPAFEREYLLGQIDGHQRLLAVQDRYLSSGRNRHHRHLAMLARGRINEHLRELSLVRNFRG
jgi:putative membrane protein